MKREPDKPAITYACTAAPIGYRYEIAIYENGTATFTPNKIGRLALGKVDKKTSIPASEVSELAEKLLKVDTKPEFVRIGVPLDGWSDSLTLDYGGNVRIVKRSNEILNKEYDNLIRKIESYFGI